MGSFATFLSTCVALVSGVAAAGEQSQQGVQGERFLSSVSTVTLLKSPGNNFLYSTTSPQDLRSRCVLYLFDALEEKGLAVDSDLRSEYMNGLRREAKTEDIYLECFGAIAFAKGKSRGQEAGYDGFMAFLDKETGGLWNMEHTLEEKSLWKREPTFEEIARGNRRDSVNVLREDISPTMMRMMLTLQAAEAASYAEDISARLALEIQAKLYFLQEMISAVQIDRTKHVVPYYTDVTANELREICIQSIFDALKEELKINTDEVHEQYVVELRQNRPATKSEAYRDCLGAFGRVKMISDYKSLVKLQGEIYLDAYLLVDSCRKYPKKEDYANPSAEKVKECLGGRKPHRAKAVIALQLARLVAYPKDTLRDTATEGHKFDSELLALFNFIDQKPLASGATVKYDASRYYRAFQK